MSSLGDRLLAEILFSERTKSDPPKKENPYKDLMRALKVADQLEERKKKKNKGQPQKSALGTFQWFALFTMGFPFAAAGYIYLVTMILHNVMENLQTVLK